VRIVRLIGLMVVGLLAACPGPGVDTPEAAYAAFAQAQQRGNSKAAYERLSEATRRAIEARSKEISAASGGSIRDEPALLTFATGAKPLPVTEVKVMKVEGDTATILAVADGTSREVKLVREAGRWKVDLSERFSK
jgi:hypothetical protein